MNSSTQSIVGPLAGGVGNVACSSIIRPGEPAGIQWSLMRVLMFNEGCVKPFCRESGK